jgi:hypothetical protein
MNCRQLIDGAFYGPEAFNAVTQAFDVAWGVVAGNHAPDTHEAERLWLSSALLSVACEDSRDVQDLKCRALEAMAISYR